MELQKLFRSATFLLLPLAIVPHAFTQPKNEVGLVIGATATPSQTLRSGSDLGFKPSLALGAEYDRRLVAAGPLAVYGGGDFLASPFDVKLDRPRPAPEQGLLRFPVPRRCSSSSA